jgi:hypothetical protein
LGAWAVIWNSVALPDGVRRLEAGSKTKGAPRRHEVTEKDQAFEAQRELATTIPFTAEDAEEAQRKVKEKKRCHPIKGRQASAWRATAFFDELDRGAILA